MEIRIVMPDLAVPRELAPVAAHTAGRIVDGFADALMLEGLLTATHQARAPRVAVAQGEGAPPADRIDSGRETPGEAPERNIADAATGPALTSGRTKPLYSRIESRDVPLPDTGNPNEFSTALEHARSSRPAATGYAPATRTGLPSGKNVIAESGAAAWAKIPADPAATVDSVAMLSQDLAHHDDRVDEAPVLATESAMTYTNVDQSTGATTCGEPRDADQPTTEPEMPSASEVTPTMNTRTQTAAHAGAPPGHDMRFLRSDQPSASVPHASDTADKSPVLSLAAPQADDLATTLLSHRSDVAKAAPKLPETAEKYVLPAGSVAGPERMSGAKPTAARHSLPSHHIADASSGMPTVGGDLDTIRSERGTFSAGFSNAAEKPAPGAPDAAAHRAEAASEPSFASPVRRTSKVAGPPVLNLQHLSAKPPHSLPSDSTTKNTAPSASPRGSDGAYIHETGEEGRDISARGHVTTRQVYDRRASDYASPSNSFAKLSIERTAGTAVKTLLSLAVKDDRTATAKEALLPVPLDIAQPPGAAPDARPSAPVHPAKQAAEAIFRVGPVAQETEFLLMPEELGRLRFSIQQTDGAMTISISAERPETLALMRRHSEVLLNELGQSGMEGATLDFRDDTSGQTPRRSTDVAEQSDAADVPAATDAQPVVERTALEVPGPGFTGRLDLRV